MTEQYFNGTQIILLLTFKLLFLSFVIDLNRNRSNIVFGTSRSLNEKDCESKPNMYFNKCPNSCAKLFHVANSNLTVANLYIKVCKVKGLIDR